jgi:hypothetical protein
MARCFWRGDSLRASAMLVLPVPLKRKPGCFSRQKARQDLVEPLVRGGSNQAQPSQVIGKDSRGDQFGRSHLELINTPAMRKIAHLLQKRKQ